MEFGRWGLEKISRISNRYRDFTEFLTDVLEGERSLIDHDPGASDGHFQPRTDIESFIDPKALSRVRPAERLGAVFRALAPYFEAGFLLRPSGDAAAGPYALESMFAFGKVFRSNAAESPRVKLALPDLRGGRVVRGRVAPVLAVFRLDAIEGLRDAAAFAFAPPGANETSTSQTAVGPPTVIVLICNRPHPWQVGAVERAVTCVAAALGGSASRGGSAARAGRIPP